MRYKLTIRYDGTYYYGFQRQSKLVTIQEEIEKALYILFKTPILIKGAGRTDAKVHALAQVAHFDSEQEIPVSSLQRAMNKILHPHIHIQKVEIVEDSFHARLSAVQKEYRYYISTKPFDPLKANYVYYYPKKMHLSLIKEAINKLVGTKDFTSLSKETTEKDCVRTIEIFEVKETEGIYEFRVVGNGFLRNMIRIMMALVLKVNEGKYKVEDIDTILKAKDRTKVPYVVPPQGLYLYQITYDEKNKIQ